MPPKQKMVSVRVDQKNYKRLVLVKAYLMSRDEENTGFNEAIGKALDVFEVYAGPDFEAVRKNREASSTKRGLR